MRHVDMRLRTELVTADLAYQRISDFARYPELTETVLEVDLQPHASDGSVISSWLVSFGRSLPCQ